MELHPCLLFLTLLGIHRLYLSKPFKPKAFGGTINFVGKLEAAYG
jgi:TM2 domain-containing membrane protein YozV